MGQDPISDNIGNIIKDFVIFYYQILKKLHVRH